MSEIKVYGGYERKSITDTKLLAIISKRLEKESSL